MWIVVVGLLLYLTYTDNAILFFVNIALGIVLLLTTDNLMSDNIEYLYVLSAIVFVIYQTTKNRFLIVLKLILDATTYILVSTTVEYNWIFTIPIVLDIMQLCLFRTENPHSISTNPLKK